MSDAPKHLDDYVEECRALWASNTRHLSVAQHAVCALADREVVLRDRIADLERATAERERGSIRREEWTKAREHFELAHRQVMAQLQASAEHGAVLVNRIAQLEAALHEIADFSEQFIGDDEDGDERMYRVNQIADATLASSARDRGGEHG